MLPILGTLAANLQDAAEVITGDLASAQPIALGIFGIIFGVPLVLMFFKRLTH